MHHNQMWEKKRKEIKKINHYKYDTPKLTRISLKGKRYQKSQDRQGGREGERGREGGREENIKTKTSIYTFSLCHDV